MSNHFSAANLKHPGDDPRLDLTDLFVFAAPDHPDRTVLIMNANPFTNGNGFHPDAVYRFNIDNDGDALADVAFSFTFSQPHDGRQTATAHYATGRHAQTREPSGEVLVEATPVGLDAMARPVQAGPCRLFIGKRSDPFFADADGVLHWLVDGAAGSFQWTGTDTFADANIFSIVVEAPNDLLGPGPSIGAWITTSLRRDGTLVPMDREGNPSFNPILNPNAIKDQFNATDPVDDVQHYLQPLSQTLQRHGYAPDDATAAARTPAARHPPLRPHQAGPLPQRPGHDRRRLLRPHDLHGPRAGHPPKHQTTPRSDGRVPIPRNAAPLAAPSKSGALLRGLRAAEPRRRFRPDARSAAARLDADDPQPRPAGAEGATPP
jgi:Domain of unknown function (DUF4331)